MSTDQKPVYYKLTEQWGAKIVLYWSVVSLFVGLAFIGVAEAIAITLMTVFMSFMGYWMIFIVLRIQKNNRHMPRKVFDLALLFFWGGALLFPPMAITQGVYQLFTPEPANSYFFLAASVFPIGVAIGVANIWEQRFAYK